ncbi:hypothetical protein [Streptomyces cucumeris]|uniref:hypothetical protein n=1 Tax=Streptomyces cucumeris TaxID=2962890 RepID=UPI0020C864C4|nr:hypothetical protein [Streptomyces sp. NEAU-Y11]MCP9205547.1 hypothetical protein [Streptomyces sp. NEAU-Y11]
MITTVLGGLVGGAFVWILRLARTVGVHRPAPARPTATFRPIAEGTVWQPCHDVTCGHMTTRWVPTLDGYRCERAAEHRGAIHLTPGGAQ